MFLLKLKMLIQEIKHDNKMLNCYDDNQSMPIRKYCQGYSNQTESRTRSNSLASFSSKSLSCFNQTHTSQLSVLFTSIIPEQTKTGAKDRLINDNNSKASKSFRILHMQWLFMEELLSGTTVIETMLHHLYKYECMKNEEGFDGKLCSYL